MYHMGTIYHGLGTGGGVAFWDNPIKCFLLSSLCFSEHSKQRRKSPPLLSYLCPLLKRTSRLAHVPPTANTQGRGLVVVPLTVQHPSVTTVPPFSVYFILQNIYSPGDLAYQVIFYVDENIPKGWHRYDLAMLWSHFWKHILYMYVYFSILKACTLHVHVLQYWIPFGIYSYLLQCFRHYYFYSNVIVIASF